MQNIVQKINRSSLRIKFQSQDYSCLHFLLLHQSIDNIHFKCSYDYVHNIFLWKHLCKLKHSHTSFAQSNRRHWRWALQGCTIRVALFCCVSMRMGLVCQKTFWLCKLRQMIFFVKETKCKCIQALLHHASCDQQKCFLRINVAACLLHTKSFNLTQLIMLNSLHDCVQC